MEDSFGYSYRSGECPAKSSYPYSCAVEIDKTYFYYTQDYLDLIGGEEFLPCGDGDMSSGDYGSGDGSDDVGIDEDSIVPVPSSGGEVSGYIFDSTWESNRFSFSPSESGFFCGMQVLARLTCRHGSATTKVAWGQAEGGMAILSVSNWKAAKPTICMLIQR